MVRIRMKGRVSSREDRKDEERKDTKRWRMKRSRMKRRVNCDCSRSSQRIWEEKRHTKRFRRDEEK